MEIGGVARSHAVDLHPVSKLRPQYRYEGLALIKFFISLSVKGQAAEARRRIVDYLAGHGIEETVSGIATLSFAASPEAFDEVFLSTTRDLSDPLPRPPETVGASGPFEGPQITVPEELEPFVEQVSIAPSARHFRRDV